MKRKLPYSHLNLVRNPFGELPPDERAVLAIVNVDELVPLMQRPPFVVQFLGESGRGKSTHLLALRRHFQDAPYVHLVENEPAVLPHAPVLFVDETQRLSRFARRRLFQRRGALAVGTHEDHATELRRLEIPFRTFPVGGVTLARLAEIVERRLESARRGSGPIPRVPSRTLEALLQRHGDDVRAIEHSLYEHLQCLDAIEDVQVS